MPFKKHCTPPPWVFALEGRLENVEEMLEIQAKPPHKDVDPREFNAITYGTPSLRVYFQICESSEATNLNLEVFELFRKYHVSNLSKWPHVDPATFTPKDVPRVLEYYLNSERYQKYFTLAYGGTEAISVNLEGLFVQNHQMGISLENVLTKVCQTNHPIEIETRHRVTAKIDEWGNRYISFWAGFELLNIFYYPAWESKPYEDRTVYLVVRFKRLAFTLEYLGVQTELEEKQ